mmetsp:Transcript_9389/g.21329  ORF Transcript_9389/g.21329 Transcript_9389/m.21329 type:complete len:416 (+) Transcript_9389:879-2126(+)
MSSAPSTISPKPPLKRIIGFIKSDRLMLCARSGTWEFQRSAKEFARSAAAGPSILTWRSTQPLFVPRNTDFISGGSLCAMVSHRFLEKSTPPTIACNRPLCLMMEYFWWIDPMGTSFLPSFTNWLFAAFGLSEAWGMAARKGRCCSATLAGPPQRRRRTRTLASRDMASVKWFSRVLSGSSATSGVVRSMAKFETSTESPAPAFSTSWWNARKTSAPLWSSCTELFVVKVSVCCQGCPWRAAAISSGVRNQSAGSGPLGCWRAGILQVAGPVSSGHSDAALHAPGAPAAPGHQLQPVCPEQSEHVGASQVGPEGKGMRCCSDDRSRKDPASASPPFAARRAAAAERGEPSSSSKSALMWAWASSCCRARSVSSTPWRRAEAASTSSARHPTVASAAMCATGSGEGGCVFARQREG